RWRERGETCRVREGGEELGAELVQRGVKRAKRKEPSAVEKGEAALARWMKKETVERASGSETQAKVARERSVDGAAGCGPIRFAAGVGEQRIERELGALESHRHAMAGEWRDHRAGVAETDLRGRRDVTVEVDGGDGGEGVRVDIRVLDTRGEVGQFGGGEIAEAESGTFGAQF